MECRTEQRQISSLDRQTPCDRIRVLSRDKLQPCLYPIPSRLTIRGSSPLLSDVSSCCDVQLVGSTSTPQAIVTHSHFACTYSHFYAILGITQNNLTTQCTPGWFFYVAQNAIPFPRCSLRIIPRSSRVMRTAVVILLSR